MVCNCKTWVVLVHFLVFVVVFQLIADFKVASKIGAVISKIDFMPASESDLKAPTKQIVERPVERIHSVNRSQIDSFCSECNFCITNSAHSHAGEIFGIYSIWL